MKSLLTICARGGSKGIPGKNVKTINGKPLIAYTIEIAKKISKLIDSDIALSTDSQLIKNVALDFELKTDYVRPAELSLDETGKVETLKHLLSHYQRKNEYEYDYILDLDVTSPLRNVSDIMKAFDMLNQDNEALNIFSVSEPNRNPYFNIVEKKENGYFDVVKTGDFFSRQQAPKVYDMNSSFYIYKKKYFQNNEKKTTTSKSLVYIMPHICFDLDNKVDFEFMEYLITSNKLDFSF